MAENLNHTTPVARLVKGSLYKENTTDAEGKPLITKSGPNAGKPRIEYFFAVAIAKTGQPWWETDWGKVIMQAGATAFPQQYVSPTFAWKVADGDSQIPNSKGKRNCDRPGHAGHWILSFSSGFAPKLYRTREGTNDQYDSLPADGAIKLGHFVQVNFNVGGNGSSQQPGVFLNHSMVHYSAFGPEISVGPDAASAGFGQSALPPGASAIPIAGGFAGAAPGMMPQMGAPQMPGGFPQMPGAPMAPAMGAPMMPQMGAPQMPQMQAPPMTAPTPVAAAPVLRMSPQAGAYTKEQYYAAGYSDQRLVAENLAAWEYPAPAAPAPMMQAPPMMAPQMPQMGAPQMPAMGAPIAPGFSAPGYGAPGAAIAGAIPVMPNAGFVQIPAAAPAPQMMQQPATPQMTQKANGAGWDVFVSQGWTVDAARAQGYIY